MRLGKLVLVVALLSAPFINASSATAATQPFAVQVETLVSTIQGFGVNLYNYSDADQQAESNVLAKKLAADVSTLELVLEGSAQELSISEYQDAAYKLTLCRKALQEDIAQFIL